jgi:hypothetical protein
LLNTEKNNRDEIFSLPIENISILKITALWAFSESAFGGILHAISVPFRGMFINSAAVLFISLLALFSKNKNDILKSTLIVLLIKFLVSPHTPLTAYFAVTVQGLLGYLLFFPKNIYRLSAFILGILTLFFSGIQKIVVLTLVFGNTLWKSLNIFIQQVAKEFLSLKIDLQFGYLLITLYLSIHLLAGIFIGYYAGKLPEKINRYKNLIPKDLLNNIQEEFPLKQKRKKRNWFFRPSGIIIIFVSISILVYSYLYPHSLDVGSNDIVVMLIRSIVITFIWFGLIGPFIKNLFQKYLEKKKSSYSKEINYVLDLFPQFKKVVSYCWKNSSDKSGIKRIRKFLSTTFYYLLLS